LCRSEDGDAAKFIKGDAMQDSINQTGVNILWWMAVGMLQFHMDFATARIYIYHFDILVMVFVAQIPIAFF
jgi:type III secretory pathway component EscV